MGKIIKAIVVSVVICGIYVSVFSPEWASGETFDLTLEGEVLPPELKDIPLKDILEKLEREKGISLKGNSSACFQEFEFHLAFSLRPN